jgi:hypothetical protein
VNRPATRWWPQAPAGRLRIIGAIVLVGGLAGACIFYWNLARTPARTMDDLLPGYSQARARQNEILMGTMVVTLLGWVDALKDPTVQALIIAGVSGLAALACFRIASLLERNGPAQSDAGQPTAGQRP